MKPENRDNPLPPLFTALRLLKASLSTLVQSTLLYAQQTSLGHFSPHWNFFASDPLLFLKL